MSESSNKRAVIVGLFILAGITFLLAAILMVGNINNTFKQKMQVVALFDDVSGLQEGNNVWFSGVKIGNVNEIRFVGQSQVAVNLKIDTKAQQYIRKDSKVKVSTDGLIGNKILVIYGGSSGISEVENGDTLLVDKTFSPDDMINMLQENNKNVLAITSDLKSVSKKIAAGEGTIGKLLNDNSLYNDIDKAAHSLQATSDKAQLLIGSLNTYASGLNKKGTLANDLTTDTVVFKSLRTSVTELQQFVDTANVLISGIKAASSNTESPMGILLHDKESGAQLKKTLENLEKSSQKLDEDLEAVQHNFLLRKYFRKKEKAAKKAAEGQKK
jgi:phospholipid/cholesterol/gamma-HCH transport system substrate-binding protein